MEYIMTIFQIDQEKHLLAEIDLAEFERLEASNKVKKIKMDLTSAETILIGASIRKDRLIEELRKLRNRM
jgi:menaquinone-dependent protoporphyrinogen IX oxidase